MRFSIDIKPNAIALNRRDRARGFMLNGKVQARVYVTPAWKKAVADVVADLVLAWSPRPPMSGPVRVELLTRWPQMHRKGPSAGLAYGDVDATTKAVLDALAKAGVLEDDGQVVECVLRKQHGKPGLVVDVEPVNTEQVVMY